MILDYIKTEQYFDKNGYKKIIRYFEDNVKYTEKKSPEHFQIICIIACFKGNPEKELPKILSEKVHSEYDRNFTALMHIIKPKKLSLELSKEFDKYFMIM